MNMTPFQQVVLEQPAPITKPSELLRAAKAVIADPARFTIGHVARNTSGEPTGAISPSATCWCSIGAYYKGMQHQNISEELDSKTFSYLVRAAESKESLSVAAYSDTHTHAEVMAMWDAAIKLAVVDELDADL